MLVFVDESGDTGLIEPGKLSSKYFVVTMVLFEDAEQALLADNRVAELKSQLDLDPRFEFHFAKLKPAWKTLFLQELANFEFFYFSVVIDKAEFIKKGIVVDDALHRYTCGLVFEAAKPYLTAATVVMDGQGSELIRRDLTTYLRQKVRDDGDKGQVLKKLKLQDSKKNNLLQLADVVCGAVARSLSEKSDAQIYRKLISHREMSVATWPK